MTKLAAPLIIAAHVDTLPTLPGWGADGDRPAVAVHEGARADRGDVRRWVTVGYVSGDNGAAVHLEPTHDRQGQTIEAGTVACELVVGAADVATARAAVFDLLAAWSGWLSESPTLPEPDGRARLMAGSALTLVADVVNRTTRAGATAVALVSITYRATTYG